MSRSGYSDDCCGSELNLYRGRVARTIKGKRGQEFLRELAAEMDAMPEKVLIADELIDETGCCCTIGVVCKSRGIPVDGVDVTDPENVGNLVGISRTMAAEIEFINDEAGPWDGETDEQRWTRVRRWAAENIIEQETNNTKANPAN